MAAHTPTNGLRTSAYWRQRAEEARARAQEMHDVEAKATMENVATMYDAMAVRAEIRERRTNPQA